MVCMSEHEQLLERAAAFIRLPSSPDQSPEVSAAGRGLICPTTGVEFPYRDGILDLLLEDTPKTVSQQALDTAFTAWFYEVVRETILKLVGMPDFKTEVANIQTRLQVHAGDTVVDLACGHGNFTIEWARLTGVNGLIIGLDISRAMLARAAARVASSNLKNVLLIHGDAQSLPFASEAFQKVNCSGGFHGFPDLPRALREIARISSSGTVLTASMFAEDPRSPHPRLREWLKAKYGFHIVPPPWLGEHLLGLGYLDYTWSIPKRWFAYTSAVKGATLMSANKPLQPTGFAGH